MRSKNLPGKPDNTTVAFEGATAKLTIGSLDEPTAAFQVVAQYNPREIQIDQSSKWSPHTTTDKTDKSDPLNITNEMHLEYGGPTPRTLQVEMLFDGYERNGLVGPNRTVMQAIEALETLAAIRDTSRTKEDYRRPHWCVVSWGNDGRDGIKRFQCIIESISTKYQMFSSTGKVLRATCTVKLKEAGLLGITKAERKRSSGSVTR